MEKGLYLSCGQIVPAPAWNTHLVQVSGLNLTQSLPEAQLGASLERSPFLSPPGKKKRSPFGTGLAPPPPSTC